MESEFGVINRKNALIMILVAIIIGIGNSFSQFLNITAVLILLAIFVSLLKNPFAGLGYYIVSSPFIFEIFPTYISVLILIIIAVVLFLKNPKMIRGFKAGILLLSSISIIIVSYFIGYKSNGNTAMLMIVCVAIVLILYNHSNTMTEEDVSILVWSYICQAFTIAVYFLGQILNGGLSYTYGRLSFFGDIKTVSIIVSIPLIFILCTKLEGKKLFQNIDFGIWSYGIVLVFSIILIATAARGMILAVLIAVIIQMIFSKNKKILIIKLLPVIFFLTLFIILNLNNPSLRISRLFEGEEFASGNGRTEIWGAYISTIFNSGIHRILFGMGPGEISRIGNSGYYAHSAFLDFFFSYGLLGFIIIIVCEIKLLTVSIKSKDIIIISLMIALIIMYSVHGSCASTTLFILQIMLFMIINKKQMRTRQYENFYTTQLV